MSLNTLLDTHVSNSSLNVYFGLKYGILYVRNVNKGPSKQGTKGQRASILYSNYHHGPPTQAQQLGDHSSFQKGLILNNYTAKIRLRF